MIVASWNKNGNTIKMSEDTNYVTFFSLVVKSLTTLQLWIRYSRLQLEVVGVELAW